MAAATSPTLFASAGPAPTPTDVADDHSLLTLDRELDFLLEQIEDEIEESGEASKEAMERFQLFCQAMNVKVDRIGRYLAVMKTRAVHSKEEALAMQPELRGRKARSPVPNPWSSTTWRATISSSSKAMISPSVARKTRRTA